MLSEFVDKAVFPVNGTGIKGPLEALHDSVSFPDEFADLPSNERVI